MAACLTLRGLQFGRMLRHFCSPPGSVPPGSGPPSRPPTAPIVPGRLPRTSDSQSYESKSRLKAIEKRQMLKLKKDVANIVKPPLAVAGIEGRFASALFSAAVKQNNLSEVEKDMNSLKTALQNNPEILQFLTESSRDSKKTVIEDLGKEIHLSDTVVKLVSMLAENGRIQKTLAVVSAFEILMDAHRGVVKGSVVTAQPLSDSEIQDLKNELSSRFVEEGLTLELSTTVDPGLIEGMEVQIKDTIIDMSLMSRINRMFYEMDDDNIQPRKKKKKKKKKRKFYDPWNDAPKKKK